MLFIVTAASRPVNKNVNTGAVLKSKTMYRSSRAFITGEQANYQTGGYKFRPMRGWNGTIGSQPFVYERTY